MCSLDFRTPDAAETPVDDKVGGSVVEAAASPSRPPPS